MCFVSKKKLTEMQNSIKELTEIVKNQELIKLREESKELSKLKDLISKVQLKVKNVKSFDGEEIGNKVLKITYETPIVTLIFDDNNEPSKNDFFYAVNMLDLISLDDMTKVQKEIWKIQEYLK